MGFRNLLSTSIIEASAKESSTTAITMLMATHDSLADEYVDAVYHLRDGQVGEIDVKEQAALAA